jgi:hypothetical protein
MNKRPSSLGDCIPRLCSGWRDGATCHTIALESTTAIVLVNCLHGSCYILRARSTRLLKLERRAFNEWAISKWLPVP